MLSADAIVANHDHWTTAWHREDATLIDPPAAVSSPADFLALVTCQHRENFELWHTEDEARTPNASDATIVGVKRRIDKTNQRRNDLAEKLDEALLAHLAPQGLPASAAPLHSESPGLIIDRLSILSLKIYHTGEEVARTDVQQDHRERNQQRLKILLEQRVDLASCLDALWREVLAGTRHFKIYRQMKMYNDPSLNPAIYKTGQMKAGKTA